MRRRAIAWVGFGYTLAFAVAVVVAHIVPFEHPIAVALCADLVATAVVFCFSFGFRNSSYVDAYWSVAPIFIAGYWVLRPEAPSPDGIRIALVLLAIGIWGARLSWNWSRGFEHIRHEDWRYAEKREEFPRSYWLVSLFGLHLMPMLLVFFGCLPTWAALAAPVRPLGWLDAVAVVVCTGAIAIEAISDAQLWRYREGHPGPGRTLTSGLWGWSRHPNYLGEMLFWWGLYLFGLAANPAWALSGLGALAISLMFVFVSLPMMERRARARRLDFEEVAAEIPLLVRWPGHARRSRRTQSL